MRLLVLALLVANAAFFTWRYNEALEARLVAARAAPTLPANAASLTLVAELDELPPRRLPPEAAAPAAADTPAAETWRPEADASATPPMPPGGPLPEPAERATLDFPTDAAPTAPPAPDAPVAPDSAPSLPPSTGLAVTPTAPLPEAAIADAPPSAPAPGTGAPSGVCVRIGPFTGREEYAPLLGWLTPRSTTLNVETVTTAKRKLFWVYLQQDSALEARRKLAELARNGVRDTLLVSREDVRNAISLGVFSTQDAVNRRLAEVARKGYQPLVVPRVETTDLRWLNVELASGFSDSALIPAALRGNAGVEDADCAGLAGGPAR